MVAITTISGTIFTNIIAMINIIVISIIIIVTGSSVTNEGRTSIICNVKHSTWPFKTAENGLNFLLARKSQLWLKLESASAMKIYIRSLLTESVSSLRLAKQHVSQLSAAKNIR